MVYNGDELESEVKKMNLVYIHGFNSAFDPASEKVQELLKVGKVHGVTYDTFETYNRIYGGILSQIPEDVDNLAFVGTSLGGYWAAAMARAFGCPSIVINPAIEPRITLQKYSGQEFANHQTGEVKIFDGRVAESYPTESVFNRSDDGFLPLVLLDMSDEVIDPQKTRELLDGYPMAYWEGGSHRFEHMKEAISPIQEYLNHCSYVDLVN